MDVDSEKYKGRNIKPIGNMGNDDSPILQSNGIRHRTVLVNTGNWKFVESEFRFVLYCGIFLWAIHFISISI